MGAHYRERHQGATPTNTPDADPDNLPGRHAPLDELATARGLTWSREDLTVAEKKDELAATLETNPPTTTTSTDIKGLTG